MQILMTQTQTRMLHVLSGSERLAGETFNIISNVMNFFNICCFHNQMILPEQSSSLKTFTVLLLLGNGDCC